MQWITAAIELLGIAVGYLFGVRQGKATERAYQLSLKQAAPRIGTRIEFSKTPNPNSPGQFQYFLEMTIYNDGNVVASKLEGKWKLSSPTYNFLNSEQTIRSDSLPASLPIKLHHSLGYHQPNAWTKPGVFLNVEVDLAYLGLDGKHEKYHTTYQYDSQSGKMTQQ